MGRKWEGPAFEIARMLLVLEKKTAKVSHFSFGTSPISDPSRTGCCPFSDKGLA